MTNMAKNTICLWYEDDAENAARFYARTFPDSSIGAVHRAPGDYPSGKEGDVLTCIANLSNDEVFTPPEFANQMLDTRAEAWAANHGGTNGLVAVERLEARPGLRPKHSYAASGYALRPC